VTDGTILEGDASDSAQICLDVLTDATLLERNVLGIIEISDVGTAGVDSELTKLHKILFVENDCSNLYRNFLQSRT